MTDIGIINPGEMGISIAASLASNGHRVYWASDGRSQSSRQRAAQHQLIDLGSLDALCSRSEIIVSVCPPHAAAAVARAVIESGFRGLFCDGNAISPAKAGAIDEALAQAGINFVDGSIIGPPAWEAGGTRFYLSGPDAQNIAGLFAGSLTDAIVIGAEIGKASALKMTFAAQTKGFSALICAINAAAQQLGVRADLEREWAIRDPEASEATGRRIRGVTAKAWRFSGEMREIAETMELAGLPPGFFHAAHEVYERMAHFKDAESLPAVEQVLAALAADDS